MSDQIFIPDYKLPNLRKKLDSMNRKAKRLNLPCHAELTIGDKTLKTFTLQLNRFTERKISVYGYYVIIDGLLPKIDNWEVCAKIEHLTQGNFIKSFSDIPEVYRESSPNCEHCKQNRKRKYTVIIRHLKTGDYKQVGLTCLGDYLRNENAQSILHWYAALDINDYTCIDDINYTSGSLDSIPVFDTLVLSLAVIESYGYMSKRNAIESGIDSTSERIRDYLLDKDSNPLHVKPEFKHENLAHTIIDKLKDRFSQNSMSDYEHNLNLIIENEFIPIRLLAYLVSIPVAYKRILETEKKEQESAISQFVGEIKERITINAKVDFINPIDGYYGTSWLCKFTDQNGNKFVWFSSNIPDFEEEESLTLIGTVKAHDIYRNEKQTKITRCKLVN